MWKPLANMPPIPISPHPGAFGVARKYDIHTGVDLYCEDGDSVFAVEHGAVVAIELFTGAKVGTPFWEETQAILIEGESGVICYGEVEPLDWHVGDDVRQGEEIAKVKRVLPLDKLRADIPSHSTSMLHIELYRSGTIECVVWNLGESQPQSLLDPTTLLYNGKN